MISTGSGKTGLNAATESKRFSRARINIKTGRFKKKL
jgi:hypothetical protein